jgi:hypothetical protein
LPETPCFRKRFLVRWYVLGPVGNNELPCDPSAGTHRVPCRGLFNRSREHGGHEVVQAATLNRRTCLESRVQFVIYPRDHLPHAMTIALFC